LELLFRQIVKTDDMGEIQMHGSMFVLLKKFVESIYDHDTWFKLHQAAGPAHSAYEMQENYPVSEMDSLIRAVADHMGIPEYELKEKFGEFLVPDLLNLYKSHLNPAWKTFETLEYTEQVMHQAARNQAVNASPPVLNVTTVGDRLLIIDYYSKRKMGALAIGIIRGIARFHHESDRVRIIPRSDPSDERVQIRVEFK
jgi:hypothetical protein